MTLPPSYRPFLSAWNNIDETKKTLSLLTYRLQGEENISKLSGLDVNDSSDAAFFAVKKKPKWQQTPASNTNQANSKGEYKESKKSQCGFCRKGNFRSYFHEEVCWRKEAYLQGKRDATEETALAASLQHKTKFDQRFSDDEYVRIQFNRINHLHRKLVCRLRC